MRFQMIATAAIAAGAVALLAACSGSQQSSSAVPGSVTQSQSHHIDYASAMRTGVAPKFFGALHFGHSRVHVSHKLPPGLPRKVFVSDFGTGAVEVLNQQPLWTLLGTITAGMDGPDGITLDSKVNLYVANYAGIYINQYAKPWPSSASTFTYSSGMTDPVGVGVDSSGNVYEADYDDGGGNGYVNEYAQQSNTVVNQCFVGGNAEGVAVDSAGDVFVSYNSATTGTGKIAEYVGGLSGCSETVLGVSLGFAGGLAIDKSGNLLANDQTAPSVDIIDPPYDSVTSTCGSGYADPFHVTINKRNNKVLVADLSNADVQVLEYPSCTNLITLNSANGLSDPAAVVFSLNAVY